MEISITEDLVATPVKKPIIMFKFGTKEKPFRCQLCDMTFEDGGKLRTHTSKHTTDVTDRSKKPYQCKICPKSFKSSKSVERHMLLHYGQTPKRCRYCYKIFANKENLEKHMSIHEGKKPHVCPICKDQFIYKQGLESHLIIHTGARPFICHVCEKSFNRKDILDRHMHIHFGGNKKYKCVECDKTFSHSFVLKRHTRAIHSGEDVGVKCKICDKHIKSKENLSRHLKTHTGERPFGCDVCSKRFTQKAHVKEHMLIHTNELPHVCVICSEAFKHKRSLGRHMCKHTGIRPWTCNMCDLSFTEKGALNKHEQQHAEKKHQCTICRALFKQRSGLNKHIERNHKPDDGTSCKIYVNKAVQHNSMELTTENSNQNENGPSDDQIIVIVLDNKEMQPTEKNAIMEELKAIGERSQHTIQQFVEHEEVVESKQSDTVENSEKEFKIVKMKVSDLKGFKKELKGDDENQAPIISRDILERIIGGDSEIGNVCNSEMDSMKTSTVATRKYKDQGTVMVEENSTGAEETIEIKVVDSYSTMEVIEVEEGEGIAEVEERLQVEVVGNDSTSETVEEERENNSEDEKNIKVEMEAVDTVNANTMKVFKLKGESEIEIVVDHETTALEDRSQFLQTLIDYAESQIKAGKDSECLPTVSQGENEIMENM